MDTDSRRLTVFLASIAALTSLSIDMSLPGVPAMEHQFGLAAGRGGLTMSVFLAGYAFSPLIGGPLADRFGRRPILLTSLVSFAASALACSLSTSFKWLLVFRLMQGCASGVSTTLPLAIVRDLMRGIAARRRISEVTTINGMMPIIAPVFGSAVMMLNRWRLLFGSQAAFATCIVIVLLIEFKESLSPDQRPHLKTLDLVQNYGRLLKNHTFVGYALINGLTFACMFSFISVSPLILMQRMGVRSHTYILLFTLLASANIAGSWVSAILSRRHISSRTAILTGLPLMVFASATAAALQLGGLHRPIFIIPPIFVVFFGYGLIVPSVTVEAVEPVPHLAGSGSGALRSILMLFGSGISAFLAAYCSRNFAHTEIATTLTMFVTAVVALCMYLRVHRSLVAM